MIRFWRVLNDIYEKFLIGIFIIAFLVVIYSAYDTWYIFEHAGDDSYLRFKPGQVNADTVDDMRPPEDMIGWITIDGTSIDYPIMQGEDNMEYINLDPYGEYSLSGSIFLDSRNDSRFTDGYSIIYGHHMAYGSMFGALDDFMDPAYLATHSHGTLYVGSDGAVTYGLEIFYAVAADATDEKVFDVDSTDELREYLTGLGFVRNDRIICLSTCLGDSSSARTVVFAYIIE